MAESPATLQPDLTETVTNSNGTHQSLSPEQLVAKCIAPVRKDFLRPPPSRNDTVSEANENKSSVSKEKKSKRLLKRERQQEKKSASNLCPEIAKTGDVRSCPYNERCRFSHDVEAFKAQKPEDLEGECPFSTKEEACPYGLACRFYGTHKESVGIGNVASANRRSAEEMNGLNKDVQKLLWKNKMKFVKADAKLKELGLMGPKNKKIKDLDDKGADQGCQTDEASDGCRTVSEAVKVEGSNEVLSNKIADEFRPLKKCKSDAEEKCCSAVEVNGSSDTAKDIESDVPDVEPETIADGLLVETDSSLKLHPREKKLIDFRDKLYLAPLTTVGNLPFRRICKTLGADVTCGEMAMCTNLLQGQASEWALLRRHSSEDLFGVQICGAYPDTVAHTVELIDQECTVDFIDINMGCPIDIVVNKGAGSSLLNKPMRIKNIVEAASGTVDRPITVKVRTGFFEGKNRVESLIPDIGKWGANAITVHGRSRQQRYSKLADWEYIYNCASKAPESLQVIGNGDVFSYEDWNKHKSDCHKLSSCMIARGALIKPWIFTEIKEQRHWDISSGERLNILKDYVRCGLEHWGSDSKGVETTRHFLLEWLSYTCRYIPVGLLEVIPQRINWRPPSYYGRDDLETMMASDSAADWIRISEMLLGKVPAGFTFAPKHKSNAYDRAENG